MKETEERMEVTDAEQGKYVEEEEDEEFFPKFKPRMASR